MQPLNDKEIENLPLIVLLPRVVFSVALTVLIILVIFRLQIGNFTWFSVGFATFCAAFEILIVIGLRFRNRTELHVSSTPKWDWADKLGGLWLVACAFGALAGWIFLQFAEDSPVFQILTVFTTMILPFVTMLPHLRYIRSNSAYVQIPLLLILTFLPALIGVKPAIALFNRFFN
jgi:hypothetical protein